MCSENIDKLDKLYLKIHEVYKKKIYRNIIQSERFMNYIYNLYEIDGIFNRGKYKELFKIQSKKLFEKEFKKFIKLNF